MTHYKPCTPGESSFMLIEFGSLRPVCSLCKHQSVLQPLSQPSLTHGHPLKESILYAHKLVKGFIRGTGWLRGGGRYGLGFTYSG